MACLGPSCGVERLTECPVTRRHAIVAQDSYCDGPWRICPTNCCVDPLTWTLFDVNKDDGQPQEEMGGTILSMGESEPGAGLILNEEKGSTFEEM
mmetsp:Transcript_3857/g.10549  ORF Transcript_3857/g.10549 Transcript_3857/m.10549 type:complete len:95 (+) Transcript_3857:762-1046(+)